MRDLPTRGPAAAYRCDASFPSRGAARPDPPSQLQGRGVRLFRCSCRYGSSSGLCGPIVTNPIAPYPGTHARTPDLPASGPCAAVSLPSRPPPVGRSAPRSRTLPRGGGASAR